MVSLFKQDIIASDKGFERMREDPKHEIERSHIEQLWKNYAPYAEENFVSELAKQFHNRYWEMYLTCALMAQGCNIRKHPGSQHPDICIEREEVVIWVEAAAPNQGSGSELGKLPPTTPLPGYPFSKPQFFRVPEEDVLLRYTSTIREKHKQYQSFLEKNIVADIHCYILAINGHDVPYSSDNYDEIPLIVQALLPIGPLEAEVDWGKLDIVKSQYSYRDRLDKRSGGPVSIKFEPEISGVLFSRANAWQIEPRLGMDFVFVHNPQAKNPIPLRWLKFKREFSKNNDRLQEI